MCDVSEGGWVGVGWGGVGGLQRNKHMTILVEI